jgi:hypothetical protein
MVPQSPPVETMGRELLDHLVDGGHQHFRMVMPRAFAS